MAESSWDASRRQEAASSWVVATPLVVVVVAVAELSSTGVVVRGLEVAVEEAQKVRLHLPSLPGTPAPVEPLLPSHAASAQPFPSTAATRCAEAAPLEALPHAKVDLRVRRAKTFITFMLVLMRRWRRPFARHVYACAIHEHMYKRFCASPSTATSSTPLCSHKRTQAVPSLLTPVSSPTSLLAAVLFKGRSTRSVDFCESSCVCPCARMCALVRLPICI